MSKIIGIDLGTTNSCVAVMDGGECKVIVQHHLLSHTKTVKELSVMPQNVR